MKTIASIKYDLDILKHGLVDLVPGRMLDEHLVEMCDLLYDLTGHIEQLEDRLTSIEEVIKKTEDRLISLEMEKP